MGRATGETGWPKPIHKKGRVTSQLVFTLGQKFQLWVGSNFSMSNKLCEQGRKFEGGIAPKVDLSKIPRFSSPTTLVLASNILKIVITLLATMPSSPSWQYVDDDASKSEAR